MDTHNQNNVLDFQDPGMMPNELMDMPGFVNELKEHTLAVAPRSRGTSNSIPQPAAC